MPASATTANGTIPEVGQLVQVRQRQWVVADVDRSSLPPDAVNPDASPPQHFVTLTSIEDDALGEEMEVVWEIEPGARVFEKAALPNPMGFDDPARLDAFLHAVRWGAVTDADHLTVQSPFRSGIEIHDFQLDPVVRAIQMPRANLLIADDVGLGKTIEAGLVIQELLLRHRARSVLVVCPASLCIKWRDEMQEKFGLEFRIVDTELLRRLRRERGIHTNPWTHFPRLIASIDWLKRDGPMRMFRDALPPRPTWPREFDILVVDEAHNVAPAGTTNYAVDSLRTQAIKTLAPHFEHKLFLTATPHNGYQQSFTSLLELLDDQRFARGIPPDRDQLGTVMVRRLKDDIVDWKGDRMFPERIIRPIPVEYTESERDIHQKLSEYTKLRLEAAREEGSRYATHFVLKLLKKRLFSSPVAFALTLAKHRRSLEEGPKRKESRSEVGILKRAISEAEEDYADDDAYERSLDDAVTTAGGLLEQMSDRERELLDDMQAWGERVAGGADSKMKALLAWLDEHIRPNGEWSDERIIIFTEYRATHNWIVTQLTTRGYGEERLLQIYGGMDEEKREAVKAAFQASPSESPVRVLVATDAASEGIDLQRHCRYMIHAEIPWNPNRLEQRNGRIDRHGQKADEVLIHHFVGSGYRDVTPASDASKPGDLEGDLEFLMRAVRKVEKMRVDLGRVGPVIASQVEDAMLGGRTWLDTTDAERQAEAARKVLSIERKIRDRIEKLHERLLDSRRHLDLTPESIRQVVEVGLDLAGQPPLEPTEDAVSDSEVFEMPALMGTWRRCMHGLEHPHTGRRRPITFDHDVARGRDDVVLVHLEHRLVRMCLRLLRAEVWAPEGRMKLNRVTARRIPSTELDTPAVIAHARLVVIGQERHRLHEEIISAGGVIRNGRFARLNVGQIDDALSAATPRLPPEALLADLRDIWPSIRDSVMASLDARLSDRMQYLSNTLERRRDKEIDDVRSILGDLQTQIATELEAADATQIEFWKPEEKVQLEQNVHALEARMRAIPEEMKAEEEKIRERYQVPTPRLFPVSTTFLVPESLASP